MRLGYNTNGLAHHSPLSALESLAEIGFQSVALTVDHGLLNPFSPGLSGEIDAVRRVLGRHGLKNVIETGARFLLDPASKHEPTLICSDAAERSRRIGFLCRTIDIAAELNSDCVSLWSGVLHDTVSDQIAWERLLSGLQSVVAYAEQRKIVIGFEPEPGMFIDRMDRFDELLQKIASPTLRLTLDIGHLHCQDEVPIAEFIERYAALLVNIHIEDMRRGVHEHLMFGEGEIDFPPIIDALRKVGYQGGVHVELSRHSHVGLVAARQAYSFLAPLLIPASYV